MKNLREKHLHLGWFVHLSKGHGLNLATTVDLVLLGGFWQRKFLNTGSAELYRVGVNFLALHGLHSLSIIIGGSDLFHCQCGNLRRYDFWAVGKNCCGVFWLALLSSHPCRDG